MFWWILLGAGVAFLVGVAIYDRLQRTHTILRNYPVIGHLRFILEAIGPELRQYIVTDNDSERPFSRDERRWIYSTAKQENQYFGFGTDNDFDRPSQYMIVRQSEFPLNAPRPDEPGFDDTYPLPCAKVLGGRTGRARAFRPASIVNVSAMSFGSLSGPAITALNKGAAAAGALHNTGEGGVSPHHRHGADLVLQVGTGYFGCRDAEGNFDLDRLCAQVDDAPVRAIEIKLSQGAKPGLGGVLPKEKITPEIAAIRGIPRGRDCISPASHSAFHDVASMVDFIERIGDATGLPVGIKSAVGEMGFWRTLAESIARDGRGPDFITIDGGEGGTGAGPLSFTDHVALPIALGVTSVYRVFRHAGVDRDVVWIGSARLGLPVHGLFAMSLGCDMVNVAREAMLSIGCIQAQRCHTDRCPTGVATQNPRLTRGLDPSVKSVRCAQYLIGLRKELQRLSWACGVPHPAFVTTAMVAVLDDAFTAVPVEERFDYGEHWGLASDEDLAELRSIIAARGAPVGR